MPTRPGRGPRTALVAGLVFLLLGAAFLLEGVGAWTWTAADVLETLVWAGPVVLIVAGVTVALGGLAVRRDHRSGWKQGP